MGNPILDVVLFNGEFNLLKIRLKYLENTVDRFLIGQSRITFSNKPREVLTVDLSEECFDGIRQRVEFVTINSKRGMDFWDTERSQRRSLLEYVRKQYSNYSVLYCDVDEIPSIKQVLELKSKTSGLFSIPMKMTYLYANARINNEKGVWNLPKAISADYLKDHSHDFSRIREFKAENLQTNEYGCHLSYFQIRAADIEYKFQSFSHNEFDFPDAVNEILTETSLKYAISPLGDFQQSSHGLMKLEKRQEMNSVQSFAMRMYPESFKHIPTRLHLIRLYHSYQISRYQSSRGLDKIHREINFTRFVRFILDSVKIYLEKTLKKLSRSFLKFFRKVLSLH